MQPVLVARGIYVPCSVRHVSLSRHRPIPELIAQTSAADTTGTPVYDRDPLTRPLCLVTPLLTHGHPNETRAHTRTPAHTHTHARLLMHARTSTHARTHTASDQGPCQ